MKTVKLLKLYAPKERMEPFIYSTDEQPDAIPTGGIWEAIGASKMQEKSPMFQMRCVAEWGSKFHKVGDMVNLREWALVACFDMVELARTPLIEREQNGKATP